MARLSKEAWTESSLKTDEVEVEELGGSVLVRELPASFAADLNKYIQMKQVGREQISSVDLRTMERLKFAHGVIDDSGEPLFTEKEAGEVAKNHGRAFKVVLAAIDNLSDIGEEGQKAAEARFPGSGVRQNGGPVPDSETSGDAGPDLRARAGA